MAMQETTSKDPNKVNFFVMVKFLKDITFPRMIFASLKRMKNAFSPLL